MSDPIPVLFVAFESEIEDRFGHGHRLRWAKIVPFGAVATNMLQETRDDSKPLEILLIRPFFDDHIDEPWLLLFQFADHSRGDRRGKDETLRAAPKFGHLMNARGHWTHGNTSSHEVEQYESRRVYDTGQEDDLQR